MPDGITVTFKTTPAFDRGLQALIYKAGLNAQTVVRKETGELIKTLVRISPPKDPSKTRAKIAAKIGGRFQAFGEQSTNFENSPEKQGSTGIKWYAASSKFLFGAAADKDMTAASQEELLQVYYRAKSIQGSTRIVLPFKTPRPRQRVALVAKILTKKRQLQALIKRIQSHVGRLKAAWLVAVTKGAVTISGTYQPPKWVTRHAAGARGSFIDATRTPANPKFVLINRARGVTSKASTFFLNSALNIRAKAMQKNALYFMKGKKKLSDYDRGQAFSLN